MLHEALGAFYDQDKKRMKRRTRKPRLTSLSKVRFIPT